MPSRTAILALAALAFGSVASAQQARMFLGSWGEPDARNGRVYRYAGGTSWTELTPPAGLADAVWDLEWIGDELWAATMDGPLAGGANAADAPHGTSGRVFRFDGSAWTDVSPPGGFGSAVTTVNVMRGVPYVTVDQDGLYRWTGGNTWQLVGGFRMGGQAIVSSTHDGRPMLYMGEDNQDVFWMHDPDGFTPCGDPGLDPSGTMPKCELPTGDVCTADCHGGSCIHAMTEHDDGVFGSLVYGGAFLGRIYSWNRSTRLFERRDDVPYVLSPPLENNHVQGLASYRGELFAGISNGEVWASPDATTATWAMTTSFGDILPISEMLAVPQDDLLWVGHGGVPYRWARHLGLGYVQTWNGASWIERADPAAFFNGVLTLLAVDPTVRCDAGPARVVECTGGPIAVTLDGSASSVPGALGLALTATWTGDFVEGTASGLTPTVHFEGVGDHAVTLRVEAGTASAECTTVVTVRDTAPPSFEAKDGCLWPPNHRYRCFTAADLMPSGVATAHDECEGEVPVRIVAASSSQPEEDIPGGDGRTQDDLLFDGEQVCVRSERQGADREGRTYSVTLEAEDGAGNVARYVATLHVPHDQREASRCEGRPVDPGLLPHDPLPLVPPILEADYPPARRPRR